MKNRVMTCGLACVMLLAMIAVGAVVLPTHALFEKVIKHDGVTLTPEIIVTDIQNDGWRYRDPIEEPYMSGVDVATVTIHIYLSALERILVEPTLKLSFGTLDIGDAREIANPNPRFTPGGLGDQLIERQPFYYDTAANEAYWYFEDLSPATGTTISISFLMRSPYTPDGYELNITAELYEVEGDFRSTDDLAIKWVCERQTIEKYVESVDYISIRPGLVADDEGIGRVAYNVLGGSDLDVDGIVDDDSEIPVRFSFRDELPESLSYREIDKSKTVTVDTLPEMIVGGVPVRAVFDPALNDERWELQPDGITVVAVGDVSDLVLLFPRAEIGELYLNRVERTYTLAFPWGDEEATYSSKSACFVAINAPAVSITDLEKSFLKGAVAPLTPSGLTFTTRGDNLLYVDASREAIPYLINNDYWWVNQINNNLGDENIYVNLRDVVITDDALDENMMFTKFLLYMPSNLSATIEYRSAADGLWRPLVTVASTDLTSGSINDAIRAKEGTDYRYCADTGVSPAETSRASEMYVIADLISETGVVVDGIRANIIGNITKGNRVNLLLCSTWRDPNYWQTIPTEETSRYDNITTFTSNMGRFRSDRYTKATHIITPYTPRMYAEHDVSLDNSSGANAKGMSGPSGNYGTRQIGSLMTIHTRLYPRELDPTDTVNGDGLQYIVFLPSGVEYLPGSASAGLSDPRYADYLGRLINTEPEIIPNYLGLKDTHGNAMTALIWRMKPIALDNTQFNVILNFPFDVIVTDICTLGRNDILIWYTWPENHKLKAATRAYDWRRFNPAADVYDLDADRDVSEMFLADTVYFSFSAPTTVVAKKGVMGSLNDGYVYPSRLNPELYPFAPLINDPGLGEMGEAASFKLTVTNYTVANMTGLVIMDAVPFIGDTALMQLNGFSYEARRSEFWTRMTGPLELRVGSQNVIDKYDVYYSYKYPDTWAGITNYEASNPEWLTAAQVGPAGSDNWLQVRMFKVVMKNDPANIYLARNESLDIYMPVVLDDDIYDLEAYWEYLDDPENITYDEPNKVAFNSFAYTQGGSANPFVDALKVGIRVPRRDVSIEKTVASEIFNVGDDVTFDITVTNIRIPGIMEEEVTNTVVVDRLPPELTFVGCSHGSYTYDANTHTVTVFLNTLRSGEVVTFTITGNINRPGTNIRNIAEVTINEKELIPLVPIDDPTRTNNRDWAEITANTALHVRQFIDFTGYVDSGGNPLPIPSELPQAYVQVVGRDRNSPATLLDEWGRFDSMVLTPPDYNALDNYPFNLVSVPFDTNYTVHVLVPGGYELVRIEYSYDQENIYQGNDFSLTGETNWEAWVTIILRPLPDEPLKPMIRNTFDFGTLPRQPQ